MLVVWAALCRRFSSPSVHNACLNLLRDRLGAPAIGPMCYALLLAGALHGPSRGKELTSVI